MVTENALSRASFEGQEGKLKLTGLGMRPIRLLQNWKKPRVNLSTANSSDRDKG